MPAGSERIVCLLPIGGSGEVVTPLAVDVEREDVVKLFGGGAGEEREGVVVWKEDGEGKVGLLTMSDDTAS